MTDLAESSVSTERRGHVLIVSIDRPRAANSIDASVHTGLGSAWETADADPDIRCVVLTSAGDAHFCGGADLKALGRGGPAAVTPPETAHWGFAGVVDHPISTPIVAAVGGAALGGGTELALSCDVVVASSTATFGLPEVTRGLIAAAGGAFRLGLAIPPHIALEAMLTGEPLTADQAERWGLVNRVVEPPRVLESALEIAEKICAAAPLAVAATKRIARGIMGGTIASEREAWAQTARELEALSVSADLIEGITAFSQKRPPVWTGR